ncbi:type-4 fimbrial pilin related signal peptide protein [Pseudoduganella danionis]|uniref:Type II secretion system protein H n=1 Tax=Pseudoduganella danionis TaxID=1890295 RepID=A0ABW9SWF5_9BURK|nr:type-4 fimbrial pilin related signal peptide protein [Pseudoduganella danionis]
MACVLNRSADWHSTRSAGRTLVETMVVLALLALVLTQAVPAYQTILQRQQLHTTVNDMLAALRLARTHAMARGGPVLLVPLDGERGAWQHGWVVFVDRNGNRRPDGDESILLRHAPVAGSLTIRSAFSSAAVPVYLAYNAAGRPCNAGNSLAARWGTLTLRQGENVRNIKINMLGRLRVCDPVQEGASCASVSE